MLHILIGLLIGFVFLNLVYEGNIGTVIAGFILGLCVSISVCYLTLPNYIDNYCTLSEETFELKEIADNQYWESYIDTTSLYICETNDAYRKETYNNDIISFTNGEKATVTVLKESPYFNKWQKILFFDLSGWYENKVSVTITTPENN